jgi:hypothetical protein
MIIKAKILSIAMIWGIVVLALIVIIWWTWLKDILPTNLSRAPHESGNRWYDRSGTNQQMINTVITTPDATTPDATTLDTSLTSMTNQEALQQNLMKKIMLANTNTDNASTQNILAEFIGTPYSQDVHLQNYQKKVRLKVLDDILQNQKMIELLPSMIELAIDIHNYDDALKYLQQAQANRQILQSIPPLRLLHLLVSAWTFTKTQRNDIKQLVDNLHQENRISKAAKDFYYALLAFVQQDIKNYSYYMDQLVDTEYDSWYYAFQDQKTQTSFYQDVSSHYLYMLIALRYFREWFASVSLWAAQNVVAIDSSYVLAQQILWYSSFERWDYKTALQSFQALEELDKNNRFTYIYFQWIVYFSMKNYTAAITQFLRIPTSEAFTDKERYLFISYLAIQDWANALNQLSTLLDTQPSQRTIFDYFTIFDELLYNWRLHITHTLQRRLDSYITECYSSLDEALNYVCLYWRAWYLLIDDKKNEAYIELNELVKRYPTSQMYLRAAKVAQELWRINEAKRLTALSLITTQNNVEQQMIKNYFNALSR